MTRFISDLNHNPNHLNCIMYKDGISKWLMRYLGKTIGNQGGSLNHLEGDGRGMAKRFKDIGGDQIMKEGDI